MSYLAQSQLESDVEFQRRNGAAVTQQATAYINDQRADFVAVAEAVLRDDPGPSAAFLRLAAAGPGIADKADTGEGTVDSSQVSDADLLSLTQASWQVVASLYFASDGTPLGSPA